MTDMPPEVGESAEDVQVTAPAFAFAGFHRMLGEMLHEWEDLEVLDQATGGVVRHVVKVCHESLEPVAMIDDPDPEDGFEWELPADGARLLFDPLLLYVRDCVDCEDCYQLGRVFLRLMASKLLKTDELRPQNLVTIAVTRFEPHDDLSPCFLHQTPGGNDERRE